MTYIDTTQAELRSQLFAALRQLGISQPIYDRSSERTCVVAHCEINDRHGVGVLLKRMFGDGKGILSIRSIDLYDGQQSFGDDNICLSHQGNSRSQIVANVQQALQEKIPQQLLSIPYYVDDILSSIAIKDLYGVPCCTYLMDDQTIYANNIPDELMRELLEKSDLRLGISQELCDAYERKYNLKFWLLPPTVEERLLQKQVSLPEESQRGILVGNIWSQQWLDRLRTVTKQSGVKIDWYGNPNRDWLSFQEGELARDGIAFKGYCAEETLIERLRAANYAVIPTASTDEASDRSELAKLSLPSRLTYIVATANTPIIVVGRKDSAAARFVEEFGIGVVCDYGSDSFCQAVRHVCSIPVQRRMRQKAAELAGFLSASDAAGWLWQSLQKGNAIDLRYERLGKVLFDADVVVTYNEINQRHGTGALVKRMFPDSSKIFSIRSFDQYEGDHQFGAVSVCLSHQGRSRSESFQAMMETLNGSTVNRVFCTPYCADDLITAMAVKEIYGVPLGVYIMDDQNISVNKIPDALMEEFLSKCSLRLATHPEIRDAYEGKYGFKFWLLPAIVPDALVETLPQSPEPKLMQSKTGALVGSIWSEQWFEMLRKTVMGSGAKLHWFGNNQYYWLTDSHETLERQGIVPFGVLAEEKLAREAKKYPYVVVPSGTLDDRDDRQEISRLSLPGRIIFILASSNTPIIILGSEDTSAAHFVKRFGIGVVCDYDAASFQKAVDYVTKPEVQAEMRRKAAAVAKAFSDAGIGDWVWRSVELGEPRDRRFEDLLPRSPGDIVVFIEPPVPKGIYRDFVPVYQAMRRLKGQGFQPDFVVDVGASFGIWAHTVAQLYPNASYILIDPLISRYEAGARDYYLNRVPNATLLEVAVSDREGNLSFQVSPDLYGSSLLNPADFRHYDTVEVEVKTLDGIARELAIAGRGLLKLDVQCAEHLVLAGAREFLARVDAIVVELSLVRYDPNALVIGEMIRLFDELGFRYADETGGWRSPVDGTLLQKEILFLRQGVLVPETSG